MTFVWLRHMTVRPTGGCIAPSGSGFCRGNSLGTPAVTAILYATSQLYPSLSRDQVVARFIECLTYPEGVGTEQADGSLTLTPEERSLWGLGIPDLTCIATPLGETMMQASSGKEVTVKGSPLPGVTVHNRRSAGMAYRLPWAALRNDSRCGLSDQPLIPFFREGIPYRLSQARGESHPSSP